MSLKTYWSDSGASYKIYGGELPEYQQLLIAIRIADKKPGFSTSPSCGVPVLSYCDRIKSLDTPYFMTGVWGICKEGRVALIGLYVRHDEKGNPEFGLSPISVWDIDCDRQHWHIEKFYDYKNGILAEIDLRSISDDQPKRAHNFMNIWSANIILTVLGEFRPFIPSFERVGEAYMKMLEFFPEIDKYHCNKKYANYTFLRLNECLSQIHYMEI